ncbi:MAG TPA: carboxypeptidase M32 [Chlamydiales bacterium]
MAKDKKFEALLEHSKSLRHFESILTLLHWDQETYMPQGGISARSEQIAELSQLVHEKKISRAHTEALEEFVHLSTGTLKKKPLSLEQKICVREWHRDYCRNTKLPTTFVKAFSQLTSEASQIWAMAKKDNNFKLFAPFLKKIIQMNREKTEILGFGDHPYDALLEAYEPCMTSARVGKIFDGLQKELTGLLKKITEAKQVDTRVLRRTVSNEKQKELGDWLCAALPMDPGYTRLDVSSHPFSMALHPQDSRITTRYLKNSFLSSIFSVLHEAGHSMYEMGLPTAHFGTPLAEPASLTVHESQSRWWETLIGRSLPFWKHMYPGMQKKLSFLKSVPLSQFYRSMHEVAPTFIRVEADEVTYGLHVILRFEIEKELIAGKLSVTDLPEAWNAKFKELFGVVPPTAAQGCLQDIHWSLGDFGYFPTYALGNLLAAQLFRSFAKENPSWETLLASGEFSFVRDWLKKNIHAHGKRYNSDEFAKRITGKTLSEEAYCQYLKTKYKEIYNF